MAPEPTVTDRGGLPVDPPLDLSEHTLQDWELLVEALSTALNRAGFRSAHESRRAQEAIPPEQYATLLYYERWVIAAETVLTEKGMLTTEDIDAKVADIRARWVDC